jgi:hypothetical protein
VGARPSRWPLLRLLLLLLLWPGLVAGCAKGTPHRAASPALAAWQRVAAGVAAVDFQVAPLPGAPLVLPAGAVLAIVDPSWRLPAARFDAGQRQALAQFVRQGGRLLLFGHAAHLVAELGLEPEAPECSVFRWGYDARTVHGKARLGLAVVSGRQPELLEQLPGARADGVVWLAGDAPCTAPLCTFAVGAPQAGQVLARLATAFDDVDAPLGAPVLVQWQCERGAVLGCGLLPALEHADAGIAAAAAAFVQRALRWTGSREVVVWELPAPPAFESRSPRELPPLTPLLPHWGWQVAGATGGDRSVDEVVDGVLLPSWQAGADLCELELVGDDGACVLPWAKGDPLAPAATWRGPAGLVWPPESIAALARQAHARGMLATGSLETLPVGDRFTERLVALRFLARELADLRRLGPAALHGFVVRQWSADPVGYGAAMLQDFQPSALWWRSGERVPPIAGARRRVHADDGAPRGLPFGGLVAGFRDGFPADVFGSGVLEARSYIDPRAGEARRGGVTADWVVAQGNDFVRARLGAGAALWWCRHDPDELDPSLVDYVHGVSLEPLRAAVAMPLASTGSGGLRAAAAQLLDPAPAGFGATLAAPAATHVLQNNWFRLLGSGGPLQFDPAGLARFDAPGVATLSPGLLRTRLFGGRPDGGSLRSERIDFLADGQRGAGRYGETVRVGPGAASERQPPALLAAGEAPNWPRAVWHEFVPTAGQHELELVLRGVRGRGVLAVSLDGVLLQALPFAAQRDSVRVVIPVHVASAGRRTLQFRVVDGGACALDRCVLRREGDVGVEARVVIAAGARARLTERSMSSYHAEVVELTTHADFPGLVVRIACEQQSRNLQVERTLALAGYELARTSGGEDASALRQPFVLAAATADGPDLVVVPLQLPRSQAMQLGPAGLSWTGAPEVGQQTRFGLFACAPGEGARWLPHAAAVIAAIEQPLPLPLSGQGEADLAPTLPLPWSRVVAVEAEPGTPFAVREQGWWSWRGSQPNPAGGRWLRVHQAPDDTVRVVAGAAVLARTRPGPGSARLLQLRDVEPDAATVRVVQRSGLVPPSVTFAVDFVAATVDGQPWAWFDGRTVFLPDVVATRRVEVQLGLQAPWPHVRATAAPLSAVHFVPASQELVWTTGVDPQRPADLPWTAVLGGPRPVAIEGGEIVDDAELRLPDAAEVAKARQGGVLVRFRAGVTKVRYAD